MVLSIILRFLQASVVELGGEVHSGRAEGLGEDAAVSELRVEVPVRDEVGLVLLDHIDELARPLHIAPTEYRETALKVFLLLSSSAKVRIRVGAPFKGAIGVLRLREVRRELMLLSVTLGNQEVLPVHREATRPRNDGLWSRLLVFCAMASATVIVDHRRVEPVLILLSVDSGPRLRYLKQEKQTQERLPFHF